jgi:hypothetical protein
LFQTINKIRTIFDMSLLFFLITNLFIIITLFVDEIAKNIEPNRHQSLHDRRGHLEPRCSWRFNHIWGRIYEVKICRLSGHGTYRVDNKIHASVLGTVEITNKLIIVNPLKAKYSPQVGDIVVGRVHEVFIFWWRSRTKDGRSI